MIIDNSRLAGVRAYLQASNSTTNIAQSPPVSGTVSGRFMVQGKGTLVEIESLDLMLKAPNLVDLFQRQDRPIVTIQLHKEMFPGLYADPYGHRVHAIGGNEDFQRGDAKNVRVIEIEGAPVLVSTGGSDCAWTSAVYRIGEPAAISMAAWDLATSRLTPEDGFRYSLRLDTWSPGTLPSSPPDGAAVLASDKSPTAARFHKLSAGPVSAYRVSFEAEVRHDAYLRERHTVSGGDPSLGRPLLRAVNLLEEIPPAHTFHSIIELSALSGGYMLVSQPNAPPERLSLNLPLPAVLAFGEGIRIAAPAHVWEVLEARLNARISVRSPATYSWT